MGGGAGRIGSLRWMCRRGMKELDTLLLSFVDANQSRLRAGEWPQLERLLETEDDLLWDCLRGAKNHPDPALEGMIRAIGNVRRPGA